MNNANPLTFRILFITGAVRRPACGKRLISEVERRRGMDASRHAKCYLDILSWSPALKTRCIAERQTARYIQQLTNCQRPVITTPRSHPSVRMRAALNHVGEIGSKFITPRRHRWRWSVLSPFRSRLRFDQSISPTSKVRPSTRTFPKISWARPKSGRQGEWRPVCIQIQSCLSMKVRSPMPCSCSCLSPTRSQRRRRELHGADSDMAQRLETAMAHTLRLGSLAELHG